MTRWVANQRMANRPETGTPAHLQAGLSMRQTRFNGLPAHRSRKPASDTTWREAPALKSLQTITEAKGSVTEASGAFSEACGPFSVLGETFSWVGHSVCCAGCRQRRARYLFPDDLGPVGRCDALPRTPEHGWQGAAERAFLALQFPARFVLCRLTRNSEKAPREHA